MKITADVLEGKESYIYLWEGRQKQFSHLLAKVVPNPKSISNFKTNIDSRAKFCLKNNIKYKHIVFPSKPLVKSRFLPDDIQVSSLYEGHFASQGVYYPLEQLREFDLQKSSYRVLDTHMTDYGSLFVVENVFKELFDIFYKSGAFHYEHKLTIAGDLERMRSPEKMRTVEEIKLEPRKANGTKFFHREFNNFKDIKANGGGISINYNPDSVSSKRLLVFGDSFFLSLLHLLRPIFREIVYIRSELFKPELVHMYQPDYVITTNTERYLSKVHSDNDAYFLFYDDMIKSFYKEAGPNDKFLLALKSFFSRTYDKVQHKQYVNNETASLLNDKVNHFFTKGLNHNAKHEVQKLLRKKPQNKTFIKKLTDIDKVIDKSKLVLPKIQMVKKYASQVFILNLRLEPTKIVNALKYYEVKEPLVIFNCSLEIILDVDVDDSSQAIIIFNNMAIIEHLLKTSDDIQEYLADESMIPTVLFLYRMLLASYFFESAYILTNLIKTSLSKAGTKITTASFLVSLYNDGQPVVDALMTQSSDNKGMSLSGIAGTIKNALHLQSDKQLAFSSVEAYENANVLRNIFYNRLDGVPNFTDEKDLAFFEYIKGKSVAIVGPANADVPYGSEIDGYDIVVRLSYRGEEKSATEHENYGKKTDISYFSAHLRYFVDEIVSLSETIGFICVTLPKFGPKVLKCQNVRETVKMESCYLGNTNLIQAALIEMLYCQPSKVKVFCSNLFLTDKPYNTAYPSADMLNTVSGGQPHRGINSITFTNHDPINNFLIMKTLYDNNVIEADHDLERVLKLTDEEYMTGLQNIYG